MHAHRSIPACLLAFLFTLTFTFFYFLIFPTPADAAEAIPQNNSPSVIETEHIAVIRTLVDDDPNLKLGAPFALWDDYVVFGAQQNGANPAGFALVYQSRLNQPLSEALHSFIWTQARIDAAAVTSGGLLATLQYDARPGAEGNRHSVVVYELAGANPPQVVGRYQMATTDAISENRINDMVVIGNDAILRAASLSTSPSSAFSGLIVVSLTQPDGETLEYDEVKRVAADLGIAGELAYQGTRLYAADDSGANILAFDVSPPADTILLATLPGNSNLQNWIVAGVMQLVGQRVPGAMALVNVLQLFTPTELVLGGELFTPLTEFRGVELLAGPTLLAKGRGHDLLVVAIDQPQANAAPYALTAGWIDFESGGPASAQDILILPSHDFIVSTGNGSDKYVLRHDGFAPHFVLKSDGAGVTVDGVPVSAEQTLPIDATLDLTSTNPATRTAIDAVCADEFVYVAFGLAGLSVSAQACEGIGDAKQLNECIENNQHIVLQLYLGALGRLCRGDAPPVDVPTGFQIASSAVIGVDPGVSVVVTLTSGASQFEALAADTTYAIVTPLATVTVDGGASADVAHDVAANFTYVAAIDDAVLVTPADPGLAALTLQPNASVRITAEGVSPVETDEYALYMPTVSRP